MLPVGGACHRAYRASMRIGCPDTAGGRCLRMRAWMEVLPTAAITNARVEARCRRSGVHRGPGSVLPGLDRIGGQPAPDRGARDRGDDALLDGGAGQVGQLQRASGCSALAGSSQAIALMATTMSGEAGVGRPGLIGRSGQALVVEAFLPLGHHLRGVSRRAAISSLASPSTS